MFSKICGVKTFSCRVGALLLCMGLLIGLASQAEAQTPTANAGIDQTVAPGGLITLDATGSSDPGGETLTYAWTQTSGMTSVLISTEMFRTFFAPADAVDGETFVFSLIVTAGGRASAVDTVTITVATNAPTADAGDAQTVAEGDTVTLMGSGTDPHGDALTFSWTHGNSGIILTGGNTAAPTFTAPNQLVTNAILVFSLIVTDENSEASTAATVTITVTAGENDAPISRPGPDQRADAGAMVTLDGSASSDPEGEDLTYTWTQTGAPDEIVNLNLDDPAKPTFTMITTANPLSFGLVVTDTRGLMSNFNEVFVTLIAPPIISTSVPTLIATVDTEITRVTIISTGGRSRTRYTVMPDLPSGLIVNRFTGTISGTPTEVASAQSYTITATNLDGMDTATVIITVNPVVAPVISASVTTLTATVGIAITPVTIILESGSPVTGYEITPDLPADGGGLALDPDTGTISGTPTEVAVALTYTITGTNDAGMDTVTVAITVEALVAPVISASVTTLTATVDTAIEDVTITSTGGAIASYSIAPQITMTPGLAFDEDTGTISGTPTAVADAQSYTITATNGGGSNTAMVTITVEALVAPVISASVSRRIARVDEPIEPVTIRLAPGSGAVDEYSILPPITMTPGLAFDEDTGTISGTPTEVADAVTYTITATNVTGTDTATVTITFNAGFADLNAVILPQIARAIADETVSAITQRIDQIRSGESARSINIAGQSTLTGAASAHRQAIADGKLSLKNVLGNSDFVLPLADDGMSTGNRMLSSLTLWGGGGYRSFEGSGGKNVNFDGDLFSAHLGLDARPRDDLVTGLAVSWSKSDLDYKGDNLKGEHKLDITSVNPYVSWEVLPGQLDLWATAGYGWGDLEINEDGPDRQDPALSDVETWDVAVGGNIHLLQRGPAMFRLKSSALLTGMEVEGSADIDALEVDSSLLRMVVEGAYKHTLADGSYVEPSLEAGVRYDGGDGETGFGAELGAGFRYTDPTGGLTLEGKARTLIGRDNYEEWGISGLILLEEGRNGRGLSFSLSPGYGSTGSNTQEIWQEGLRNETSQDHGARLDTRLGYGMMAPGGQGLLTPYSEMTLGSSSTSYRLGMRWELDALFDLNLTGERRESDSNVTDHAIMLKGDIRF